MIYADIDDVLRHFSELLKAVEEQGERIQIHRDGKPIAELVPVRPTRAPLQPHSELSQVLFHQSPALPLTEEEWPEECR